MSERVLGIDTSSWSGLFDYNKAAGKGVKFVIMKGSDVGSDTNVGFVDNQLMNSYGNAKSAGLIVGAYHWMDARRDGKYQAQYYLDNVYKKLEFDFMPIVDWEEMEGTPQQQKYIDETRYCLDEIEKSTSRIPMIYTARWFTNYFYSSAMSWMNRYPLWVAYYSNVGSPLLPTAWKDYKIWQYASNASFPYYMTNGGNGFDWGGSKQSGLDMNWFNGSYQDLLNFCSIKPVPPVEEPPIVVTPPTPPKPYQARVITTAPNRLFVRDAPNGVKLPESAWLDSGAIVGVYEVLGAWSRIGVNKWVSSEWIVRIDIMPVPVPVPETPVVLWRGKVNGSNGLYVRSTSATTGKVLRGLVYGTIVDVYEVQGTWARISPTKQEWCYIAPDCIIRIIDVPVVPPVIVVPSLPPASSSAIDIDSFPRFSQRDPRWASDRLGTSSSSFGGWGCLVTAAAAIFKYHGIDIDPGRLNKLMITWNGFANTNLWCWDVPGRHLPVTWAREPSGTTARGRIDLVKSLTGQGIPPILCVDFNLALSDLQSHFVVGLGATADNDIIIMDTWDGQIKNFSADYGSPLWGIWRIDTYTRDVA